MKDSACRNIKEIITRLRKAYPESRVSLHYKNPFQLLIATILSAQCTDKVANKVTARIFKKYRNISNLSKAKQPALEKEIYSTGFYRNKSKNIIAAAKRILKEYKGKVPKTMAALIMLPGVGRKTANIVLSSAFGKAEGIAVDTHVKRIVRRLGLTRHQDPDKIEQGLLKIVPKKDWLDFNYILVTHGRRICKSQKPLCNICVVNGLCQYNRRKA